MTDIKKIDGGSTPDFNDSDVLVRELWRDSAQIKDAYSRSKVRLKILEMAMTRDYQLHFDGNLNEGVLE